MLNPKLYLSKIKPDSLNLEELVFLIVECDRLIQTKERADKLKIYDSNTEAFYTIVRYKLRHLYKEVRKRESYK